MNSTRNSAIRALAVLALTLLRPALLLGAIPTSVEEAVLSRNWLEARKLLTADELSRASPVRHFLLGHVLLASNQPDSAFCEFASVVDQGDLSTWQTWTTNLVSTHPENAIAIYLAGDALARMGAWDDAIARLNDAARHDPSLSLVYDARGVCYAAKAQWDVALTDFIAATRADPTLSDPYASLGAMYIQKGDGADGAKVAFSRALGISPGFLLARNGRACAEIVLGEWEAAEEDLLGVEGTALTCRSRLLMLRDKNAAELARQKSDAVGRILEQAADVKPGTPLSVREEIIRDLPPSKVAELKVVLPSASAWNMLASSFNPSEVTVHGELGNKAGKPYGEVGGSMTWKMKDDAINNLNYQLENLSALERYHPDVAPARLSPVAALRSRIENWDLTHSNVGGVTTKPIGVAPVDAGGWHVRTCYGLLYPVDSDSVSERPR